MKLPFLEDRAEDPGHVISSIVLMATSYQLSPVVENSGTEITFGVKVSRWLSCWWPFACCVGLTTV
jgi:hypothetical protein